MRILSISNLKKSYGKVLALDGISLEVNPGEVYGFIGPNGAGKTTTIRTILGILKADSGDVKVFGKDGWIDAVGIHEKVAYVPGEANLWPNLTGGEVIDLFLNLRGDLDHEKKKNYIERFDLDPSKKCRTYSKGNRQKVTLIAALASSAELYILDEPTSGLDPLMEKVFQEAILELKAQGKSIFLSSHILSEVEQLCDRISIIKNGKIIESGTLEELRHLTKSAFKIQVEKPLDSIDALEGISDLKVTGDTYEFHVEKQNISKVMAYLSEYQIKYIESRPPTLEDLFMHHYTKEEV